MSIRNSLPGILSSIAFGRCYVSVVYQSPDILIDFKVGGFSLTLCNLSMKFFVLLGPFSFN